MKKEEMIFARVDGDTKRRIEDVAKRKSKETGFDVTSSDIVRRYVEAGLDIEAAPK